MSRFFSGNIPLFKKAAFLLVLVAFVFPHHASAAIIINRSLSTNPDAASGLLLYYSFDGPSAPSSRIGDANNSGFSALFASVTKLFTGLGANARQLSELVDGATPVAHATDVGPSISVPTVSNVEVAPSGISLGNSARFTWSQTNGQDCYIDNMIGSVGGAATGGVNIYATTTTTYTIYCSNDAGTASGSATIYVRTIPTYTDLSGNSHTGTYYSKPSSKTVYIATTTSSWTVPADWGSTNTLEAIGGGGGGGSANGSYGGAGGGGGAYAKAVNVSSITPSSSVKVVVGAKGLGAATGGTSGTAGGDTYFCNSTANCASISGTAVKVGAKGGGGGAAGSGASGGAGGVGTSGVGSTKYSGGAGGNVGSSSLGGGGGGGSGGPSGTGAAGGVSVASNKGGGGGGGGGGGTAGSTGSTTTGGAGGNNHLGTGGGTVGTAGSAGGGGGGGVGGSAFASYNAPVGGVGEDWEKYHGSGGGGGGGSVLIGLFSGGDWRISGGAGGDYGAGGGGGAAGSAGASGTNANAGAGGNGAQGIVVLTYTPTKAIPSPEGYYPGKIGQAVNLDGYSYVATSTGSSISGIKSIAFWAKASGSGASQGLVNLTGSSVYISTNASKVISATGVTSPTYYMDGVASSTPGLYDNRWHQIIVTTSSAITANKLEIGRANGTFFTGSIDDFRLYNSAITPNTVSKLSAFATHTALNKTLKTSTLTDGSTLKLHYTMDGPDVSSSSITDRSISGISGTLYGSPSRVAGEIGQALNFNGTNQYIRTNDTTSFDNLFASGISICMWAKYPDFSTWNRMVTINNNANTAYDIFLQTNASDGLIQFGSAGPSYKTSADAPTLGVWNHICAVTDYTSGGTKIYLNGADDGGTFTGGAPSYTADKGSLDIGILEASGKYYGKGTFDDVRVYNAVISQAAITRLYNEGAKAFVVNKTPSPQAASDGSNLLLLYTFDGPDMLNGVEDKSGNGYTATVYGGSGHTLTAAYKSSCSTYTVPADWNSSDNSIEVIGGGGGGAAGYSSAGGGPGGGGGAYSKITNVTLTPSATVACAVGANGVGGSSDNAAGGTGGDTYFCNSSSNCTAITDSAVVVGAKGGSGGSTSSSNVGGAGGAASSGIGTTKYSGGTGGIRPTSTGKSSGGGGGGAAGPQGAGKNGGNGGGTTTLGSANGGGGGGGADNGTAGSDGSGGIGGNGGNGPGGTGGGTPGAAGTAGTGGGGGGGSSQAGGTGATEGYWVVNSSISVGPSGGGGGGGYDGTNAFAGGAANYGGGGGGGAHKSRRFANGGNGGSGYMVIKYWSPTSVSTSTTPGKIGQAFNFNVGSDTQYIHEDTSIANIKTVSFWAKARSTGASQGLVNLTGSSVYISTNSSKVISATGFTSPTYYMDGVASSTPGLYDSRWHLVTITTNTAITGSQIELGRANGVYFTGAMDDFRLYSGALSASAVYRLYNRGY